MMLLPLVVSCGKESKEEASEQTYAMLEQVAELSAGGNKQAALELADSALQMHPHAIIVCDEAATDELKHGTYKYFKDIEKDNL